ncbi:MAG: AAA family ATPase [Chloroflexi bacterium]|nr:AAA family ATPase [Chloroflexota bacterium]
MSTAPVAQASAPYSHEELVKQLLQPEAYPERPATVRLVQTHVSSLFFAGDFVYKVKRPVNYGFVDYTTLARRKRFCVLEASLNGPMAPGVYLGVVEVRRLNGEVVAGGTYGGEVVDYAVKMRRLPQESSLSMLLKAGKITPDDARSIGEVVARFHAQARRGPAITRLGGLSTVRRNIQENFRQTKRYAGSAVSQDAYDDITAYSHAYLKAREGLFQQRAAEGRILDGHGDLKASDIYIVDGRVLVLDCVEFNRRFRYGDAALDIAFLAMDLDFHGRPDLSRAFVDAYVDASGDAGAREVLGFFKCYRAYVRAKVNSFRLDDPGLAGAEREETLRTAQAYYGLAHSYTQVFPRPAIIVVCGLMGTGKTTVAAELARRWRGVHVSSDVTRKELAGATGHHYEGYGQGIYAADMSRRTYDAMLERARDAVGRGYIAVLDATYRSAEERRRAASLAQELGVETWVVECVAPESTVRRRVARRVTEGTSASDARWPLYPQQKAEWEPVAEVPSRRYAVLDTRGGHQAVLQRLLRQLYERAIAGD